MSDHVILLHGLWMRSFTLTMLRRRLERAGYAVHLFDYASVMHDPDLSTAQLLKRAHALRGEIIHFVGHSLGGLMALRALEQARDLPDGRVVCLGSPLCGSQVARSIASLPGGSLLIGKSADILRAGLRRWSGPHAVGAIAGRLPIGFGVVVGSLATPNDGTVSVAETQLPGLTDHCIVPATHLGLVFSDEAANQTVAFLRTERFAHGA
ncbi:MAG TPA: alpha/beta hydrolase [Rudaea sp.]|nr:alpha/beta hydrolase [Rudaea sp.]